MDCSCKQYILCFVMVNGSGIARIIPVIVTSLSSKATVYVYLFLPPIGVNNDKMSNGIVCHLPFGDQCELLFVAGVS